MIKPRLPGECKTGTVEHTLLKEIHCHHCGQIFYVCLSCWRGQAYWQVETGVSPLDEFQATIDQIRMLLYEHGACRHVQDLHLRQYLLQNVGTDQQVTFLSDGGDTVRDLQLYLNPS